MNSNKYHLHGYAALAPMAGVADRAMREICVSHGAAFTVGELTSSRGVALGDEKSRAYLCCSDASRPTGSQLFGSEPEIMAQAAREAMRASPDFIDINMGCPAPKVAGNGGGSALMRDPDLAERIVRAVVAVSDVPVTVKMRTGWDADSLNAPELAARCAAAGAAAITVHGRTRAQMYAPGIDYDTIRRVKQSVSVPVIANGDIRCGADAAQMLESTGCDFVMVGRAAMGNPFVFEEINAYFEGRAYTPPPLERRLCELLRQVDLMMEYKDPHNAVLESRKHAAWYMTGLRGAAELRRLCGTISSRDDLRRICEKALELNADS